MVFCESIEDVVIYFGCKYGGGCDVGLVMNEWVVWVVVGDGLEYYFDCV